MRIGVCHSVTLPGEWEDAIRQAGELGFAGIELFLRPATLAELLDHPERVGALRAAAERAGVALPSLGLVFFGQEWRLTDPNPSVRDATVAQARLALRRCAELGGTVALLPGTAALDDAASTEAYLTSLRELAVAAAPLGVRVGIETGYSAAETQDVLSRVDSQWVGDYFDTGNAAGRGRDPVAEIRARGGLIFQIHVKGARGASLDAGTVDLAGVGRALREIGYDGWLMLETSAGAAPLENARHNLAILRQHFGA
ncbi:MAG: sugar phosphate isomerase/epimerase family protein [Chloroflexota bacterium]